MLTIVNIEDHINQIENGFLFVGDPFTENGMAPLGLKLGAAEVAWNETFQEFKLEDYTGDVPLEKRSMGVAPVVTMPIVLGNAALYATLTSTGTASFGSDRHQNVVTTSLLIIPEDEADGLAYPDAGPGPWAPAAPVHALWLWRVHFQRPNYSYGMENAGRVVQPVTVTAMYAHNDANIPDDIKIGTIGDPVAQGVVNLRI